MTRPPRSARLVDPHLLGRHQLAAAVGTVADFTTMIALVEALGLSPPIATMVSALAGAVVNFVVSRCWAFRNWHVGRMSTQAVRYAIASMGGAMLNAGLLAVALRVTSVPYALGRAIVSLAVSLVYTYAVHTRFVFRVRA